MPRRRPLLIVLAVTLAASIAAGWVLSRANGDNGLDARLDEPGTYGEPGGAIPTAPPIEGDPLPDLPMRTLSGADVSLSDLVGQPLVINVWYSTCVPCAKELPAFAETHRDLGDRVRFVGLNIQDGAERAERFARDSGVAYEILLDPDRSVTSALQLGQFPSTLFVDAGGRIVELHQGALDGAALRRLITEKLGV